MAMIQTINSNQVSRACVVPDSIAQGTCALPTFVDMHKAVRGVATTLAPTRAGDAAKAGPEFWACNGRYPIGAGLRLWRVGRNRTRRTGRL